MVAHKSKLTWRRQVELDSEVNWMKQHVMHPLENREDTSVIKNFYTFVFALQTQRMDVVFKSYNSSDTFKQSI